MKMGMSTHKIKGEDYYQCRDVKAERDKLLEEIAELLDRLETAEKERDALRAAMEKIADWYGSWGPYPETNKSWCAMAIVTAREAVKPLYLAPGAKGE